MLMVSNTINLINLLMQKRLTYSNAMIKDFPWATCFSIELLNKNQLRISAAPSKENVIFTNDQISYKYDQYDTCRQISVFAYLQLRHI